MTTTLPHFETVSDAPSKYWKRNPPTRIYDMIKNSRIKHFANTVRLFRDIEKISISWFLTEFSSIKLAIVMSLTCCISYIEAECTPECCFTRPWKPDIEIAIRLSGKEKKYFQDALDFGYVSLLSPLIVKFSCHLWLLHGPRGSKGIQGVKGSAHISLQQCQFLIPVYSHF